MVRFLEARVTVGIAFAAISLSLSALPASATGDAAKGADVAKRCLVCHTFDKGAANKVGPNLFGVVGRVAGTVAGYNYSTAMKNAGLTWTNENLNEYLTDPRKKVPANKMTFAGISNADQLADLIAYLDTLK